MLRAAFTQWGLPDRIRLDNGHPWGSWNDLPRALPLWLIGLGVDLIWNDPRCPEENGKVERTQGVTQQWAEPPRCSDRTQLASRLQWAIQMQREVYPAIQGQTRLEAHPALAQRRRPYTRAKEERLWQLSRVDAFLSRGVWRRLVSETGQISVYNRNYRVGRNHAGQEVSVRFDAGLRQWVVQDAGGDELARHQAEQLTYERIMELDVMHRHETRKVDGPG
jgi:hypothetical protein